MKKFKRADCVVQISLLILTVPWYIILNLSHNNFAGIWSGIIPYFIIGGWQLLSTLIHAIQPKYNKKILRRVYLCTLILIAVSAFVAYFQVDGISLVYLGLLFLSPIMAIYYCILCIIETKVIKKKQLT